MDTPALFDTHASVKRLITAGMSEAIAEALVEEQQKWHNTNLANLATKQDIALLMKDTESLRKEVKQDVESLHQEMIHQFARVDDRIEATRQETKQDVELLRQEVKQDVESLHQEMIHQFARVDDRIEATRQETKQDVESLRQEVKQDVESLHQEMIHQFARVDDRIEATHQETKQDVESLRQEVKQDVESLRQDTKHGFALIQKDIALIETRIGSAQHENKQEFARIETRVDALGDQIRILMWLMGLLFAFNGFMLAIIKFL